MQQGPGGRTLPKEALPSRSVLDLPLMGRSPTQSFAKERDSLNLRHEPGSGQALCGKTGRVASTCIMTPWGTGRTSGYDQ